MQGSDKYLKLRGSRWYYIRRVPKKVAHLDQRGKIVLSLETSSLEEACARSDALAEADRLYWLSLQGGGEAVLDVADANYKVSVPSRDLCAIIGKHDSLDQVSYNENGYSGYGRLL